jgi:hypothetical protein
MKRVKETPLPCPEPPLRQEIKACSSIMYLLESVFARNGISMTRPTGITLLEEDMVYLSYESKQAQIDNPNATLSRNKYSSMSKDEILYAEIPSMNPPEGS